jgi:streptogramin lyase
LHSTRTSAFRKIISNPRSYPAAAIAMAAVAVGIAPLTASAASAPAAAKPAAAVATVDTASASAKPAAQVSVEPASAPLAQTRSADPFSGTTNSQLLPNGTDGSQSTVPLDSAQWANATSIVNAAENLHLTPYAATIAVATSLQESKLQNLNVAVDHDSLGLFQQRPSEGWGTPAQLEDPTYAADAFLQQLPSNYQSEQVDVAAQSVQRSFDGQLYAQWEDQAAHIVYTIVNH